MKSRFTASGQSSGRHALLWLALGWLALLVGGCATPAMWHATAPRVWRPYSIEQVLVLTVSNQPPRWVVLFTQARGSDANPATRSAAWLVDQPANQIVTTSAALRHLTNHVDRVQVLPVLTAMEAATNSGGNPATFAVLGYPPTYFVVHQNGQPSKVCSLPTTTQTLYTTRACLLPLAITTDTTIVVGSAAVIVAGSVGLLLGESNIHIHK